MMPRIAFLLLPLLTACASATGERAGADSPTIEGEWRIAGIDGTPLDAPIGLSLSIDETRIDYPSGCGGHGWSYRLNGSELTTTPARSPDMECLARATFPREVFEAAAAIDAATNVERTPENGLRLSGGGRSLTIFRQ